MKIVHVTSPHTRYDVRIFYKECRALKDYGFDVFLIVADGLNDEVKENVKIYGVKKRSGRIDRILNTKNDILKRAIEINGDVYHLHDPELIPIGKTLKKMGKIVIFDAHEDLPKQVLSKPYLNKFSKYILSKSIHYYEKIVMPKFDLVITATPAITEKFMEMKCKVLNINNYPFMNELGSDKAIYSTKRNNIIFIGAITKIRGFEEMINASGFIKNNDTIIVMAGKINPENLAEKVKANKNWGNIDYRGLVDRTTVKEIMSNARAGLVTFLPVPNHTEAQPNKMFEYMSAGIPVIASNFTLWREIIEVNNCGICVDPTKPIEIAKAIDWIMDNPKEAEEMGKNGRKAVIEKYNWEKEKEKLIKAYESIHRMNGD